MNRDKVEKFGLESLTKPVEPPRRQGRQEQINNKSLKSFKPCLFFAFLGELCGLAVKIAFALRFCYRFLIENINLQIQNSFLGEFA